MSTTGPDHPQAVAARAAAEERTAILAIIERYARQLSHGHGATGAQVLEQIVEEINARDEGEPAV